MDAADVLMNKDFGAFGGATFRQDSMLKGLEAQKAMGEIAAMPALARQREAHARLYESQAAEHEENVASQRRMAELVKGLPPGGSQEKAEGPEDIANSMVNMGALAFKSGLVKQGTELISKGTTVLQHLAAAEASKASKALREARTEEIFLDQIGGLALAAKDQGSWDQTRLALLSDEALGGYLAQRGIDPVKLPTSFQQAKPIMEALATSAMKVKDRLAQTTRDRVADAEIKKDGAAAAASAASATLSRERVVEVRQRVKDVEKNGGDTTGGARALRDERRKAVGDAKIKNEAAAEAKRRQQASIDAKRFPAPSEAELKDPSKRVAGQTYSTPRGPMTWTGQGWKPLVEVAKPAAAEEDDDGED